jgi:hypothetical protein
LPLNLAEDETFSIHFSLKTETEDVTPTGIMLNIVPLDEENRLSDTSVPRVSGVVITACSFEGL